MTAKFYDLAKFMHEVYEEKAVSHGWQTQKKCRVPFDDLPEKNKETMIAVAEQVYGYMEKNSEVVLH